MTELSPQAQAVWDAAYNTPEDCPYEHDLAAALEAAADQVAPFAEITPQEDLESRREAMAWGMQNQAQLTRQQLLAIAAELRGTSTTTETP
jgi:hypothetical protein